MACLLHGTAHGAAQGPTTIWSIWWDVCGRKWPDVVIELRGDSGMGVPTMYNICERLEVQSIPLGYGSNSVLKRQSDTLLAEADRAIRRRTGQPQRLFTAFEYQAGSWALPRWVIVKAEAHAAGTNRRAVVTNRSGARVLPQAAYDEYANRGESENRNKEIKCGLEADRLSDHRYPGQSLSFVPPLRGSRIFWYGYATRVAHPPPENPAAEELPREAVGR